MTRDYQPNAMRIPFFHALARRASVLVPTAALAALACAELAVLVERPVAGAIVDAIVLVLLMTCYASALPLGSRRLLPPLALLPLLRIVSLALPLRAVPQIYWYVIIGAPLLLAIERVIHLLDLAADDLGLGGTDGIVQLAIGISGLPWGALAFQVLRPEPLGDTLVTIALAIVVLVLFGSVLEELLVRGLIQHTAQESFGRHGWLWSSATFAILYLSGGPWVLALMLGFGCWLGWCVQCSRSIVGAIIAHAACTVGLLVLWPRIPAVTTAAWFWGLWLLGGAIAIAMWLRRRRRHAAQH